MSRPDDDLTLKCEDVEPRLQDFVDAVLEPAAERRVREHLAACANCRREERELRRLLARVAELPRSIQPGAELWTGIAARLRQRPRTIGSREASVGPPEQALGPSLRRRRGPMGWTPRQWAWQAAAAVIFMAAGALVSQGLFSPGPVRTEGGGTAAVEPSDDARAVEMASLSGVHELEVEYLHAKESLWLMVYSRYEDLSPVELDIVQRNLLILDDAIRDLRQALSDDPGNRRLESSLLRQHRRGIDLLQRLTDGGPLGSTTSARL